MLKNVELRNKMCLDPNRATEPKDLKEKIVIITRYLKNRNFELTCSPRKYKYSKMHKRLKFFDSLIMLNSIKSSQEKRSSFYT